MKKEIVLKFGKPADDDINENGGQFGAYRRHGPHTGLDFLSYLDPVYASEDGIVVYSGTREGSTTRTNYGDTIVINHTPDVGDDERHIYTLYGHLDKRNAYRGQKVRKKEAIGKSGNSGTMAITRS